METNKKQLKTRTEAIFELSKYIHPSAYHSVLNYPTNSLQKLLRYYENIPVKDNVMDRKQAIEKMEINVEFADGVTYGRISVLEDFDNICLVDAFVGFSEEEWKAVQKFFRFNNLISGRVI